MKKVYTNDKLQQYFSESISTPYYFITFTTVFILFIVCVFKLGFSTFNSIYENQLLSIMLMLFTISLIGFPFLKKNLQQKYTDLIIGTISLFFVSVFEIYFLMVLTSTFINFCVGIVVCLFIKLLIFFLVEVSMFYSIQRNRKTSQVGVILTIPVFFIVRFCKNSISLKGEFLIFGCIVIIVFNLMYYFIIKHRLSKQLRQSETTRGRFYD